MVVISPPRAQILATTEGHHFPEDRQEALAINRPGAVSQDAGDKIAQGIMPMDVDLGHYFSQRDCLALVTPLHLPPFFVMIMIDGGIGHINDLVSALNKRSCQMHILKAGERFIEGMLSPTISPKSQIGVVAEKAFLSVGRMIGKEFLEEDMLGESRLRTAYLTAVGDGYGGLMKRLDQFRQPFLRCGHAMPADKHQNRAFCGGATEIQRPAEREL